LAANQSHNQKQLLRSTNLKAPLPPVFTFFGSKNYQLAINYTHTGLFFPLYSASRSHPRALHCGLPDVLERSATASLARGSGSTAVWPVHRALHRGHAGARERLRRSLAGARERFTAASPARRGGSAVACPACGIPLPQPRRRTEALHRGLAGARERLCRDLAGAREPCKPVRERP
jgi:hypothetical protein